METKLAYKSPQTGVVMFLTPNEATQYQKVIGKILRSPENDAKAETPKAKVKEALTPKEG